LCLRLDISNWSRIRARNRISLRGRAVNSPLNQVVTVVSKRNDDFDVSSLLTIHSHGLVGNIHSRKRKNWVHQRTIHHFTTSLLAKMNVILQGRIKSVQRSKLRDSIAHPLHFNTFLNNHASLRPCLHHCVASRSIRSGMRRTILD
jgi:hypothetical protein